MKSCQNCIFVLRNEHSASLSRCLAPQNIKPLDHVADGATIPRYTYCSSHREDGFFASLVNRTCGKRGRWFEPAGRAN